MGLSWVGEKARALLVGGPGLESKEKEVGWLHFSPLRGRVGG